MSSSTAAWLKVEQATDDLENHLGDSVECRARLAKAIHDYTASEATRAMLRAALQAVAALSPCPICNRLQPSEGHRADCPCAALEDAGAEAD